MTLCLIFNSNESAYTLREELRLAMAFSFLSLSKTLFFGGTRRCYKHTKLISWFIHNFKGLQIVQETKTNV